jgi:hypothetical protein
MMRGASNGSDRWGFCSGRACAVVDDECVESLERTRRCGCHPREMGRAALIWEGRQEGGVCVFGTRRFSEQALMNARRRKNGLIVRFSFAPSLSRAISLADEDEDKQGCAPREVAEMDGSSMMAACTDHTLVWRSRPRFLHDVPADTRQHSAAS